ncbi:MAG: type I glyceraldehyde-3-phosphate dehydrogenase [Alphaproteobacteria bacterium]|nr:type I glyceraldehyde-3-phosphate dehydrogenase [Alphaproteobacteria bacterium]
MALRLAINGFGRIGRLVMRAFIERDNKMLQVVGINDPAPIATKAHLLRYDSVHGKLPAQVSVLDEKTMSINTFPVRIMADRDPLKMPWRELDVDIVLECTGTLTARDKACTHLDAGAKRVLISAPGDEPDITVVYGVNEEQIQSHHLIVSNASCTTNCLAPVIKVLHDTIGIEKGFMTAVHSYTGDQRTLDASHSDLYRARAASLSMIPTSTGAARSVSLVLPELKGKLDGVAIRVPTPNVSLTDLKINTRRPTCVKDINNALREAAGSAKLKNILCVTDEPLVSVDFNHNAASAIVAMDQTRVIGGDFVRIMSWYDNEWGFSNRMLDTALLMGRLL